jgi:hypothetical protein
VWAIFIFALRNFVFDLYLRKGSGMLRRTAAFAAITVCLLFLVADKRYGVFLSLIYGWHLKNFYHMEQLLYWHNYPYVGTADAWCISSIFEFCLLPHSCDPANPVRCSFTGGIQASRSVRGRANRADKLAIFTLIGSIFSVISLGVKCWSEFTKRN